MSGDQNYVFSKEDGDGARWWYFTHGGHEGEVGETSYFALTMACLHFLAHAYLIGNSQPTPRAWLDRPWAVGDWYSLEKLVATIQAPP